MKQGSPLWANDTHTLGIKAYQLLPSGTPDHSSSHRVEIGNDYPTALKSDLDSAMAKGAARLKAILEDALGGS
jgi:nuclease S1